MKCAFFMALAALWVMPSPAQTSSSSSSPSAQRASPDHPAATQKLIVTVTDENGVAVASARVQLQPPPPAIPLRCGTDFAGHCEFTDLSSGTYELRIEKTGFYAVIQPDVQVGVTANVDVTVRHQQEAREVVDVVESAPAIDPAQISSKDELTGSELIDIPYPGDHDYHNALNFIPGVTPDSFGQLHVAGAENYQTLLLLDGFNVSQPTNGQLAARTSIESFRSIEVVPSREPAEFGKGSGGVLSLNTAMGRDRYRFTSTDFFPEWESQSTLRLTVRGRPLTPFRVRLSRERCGLSTPWTASSTTMSIRSLPSARSRLRLARGQPGEGASQPDRPQHCHRQLSFELLS